MVLISTKPNAEEYSYEVFWSEEDQEFVAIVKEFSGLSWLEKEKTKALAELKNLVARLIDGYESEGKDYPKPLRVS